MRDLVLRMIVDGVAPVSLDSAETAIATIPGRPQEVPRVTPEHIKLVADGGLRALLLRLERADSNTLRNRVVHKDAYRPTLEEAKQAYTDAREILFGLTARLRLGGDATWYLSGAGR